MELYGKRHNNELHDFLRNRLQCLAADLPLRESFQNSLSNYPPSRPFFISRNLGLTYGTNAKGRRGVVRILGWVVALNDVEERIA